LGLDDGQIKKIEISSKLLISLNAGHPVRVKSIQLVDDYMFTADSSGLIKVWKNNSAENSTENFEEVANVNADARITCMAVSKMAASKMFSNEKKNLPENERKEKLRIPKIWLKMD